MKNVENLVAPTSMFMLDGNIEQLVGILTGHKCVPCEGSTGHSLEGDYEEGDVSYYNCDDGLGYTLSYNFKDAGFDMSRLISYKVIPDDRFNGMFDVTRKRLENVLKEYDKLYEDWDGTHELLLRIGGKFGIRL